MKILITGAKGQLGNKLIERLQVPDNRQPTTDYQLILTDSEEMDITDKTMIERVLSREKPDFIIHAAAYTQVDKAEGEGRELCYKVNAVGTKNLAEIAAEKDTTLLYISTDYVFPGTGNVPINEDDPTDPVNFYGQTKLEGEKAIQAVCDKYYIIRTAWLYGELPQGHPGSNFVETMLRLAKERDSISVVSDQIGSPTYTGDLVGVIAEIIFRNRYPELVSGSQNSNAEILKQVQDDNNEATVSLIAPEERSRMKQSSNAPLPYGIYHATGEGEASWYDFAKEIFKQSKVKIGLKPIATAEYPTPAKRPAYSYLTKAKLNKYGLTMRPWQEALGEVLEKR